MTGWKIVVEKRWKGRRQVLGSMAVVGIFAIAIGRIVSRIGRPGRKKRKNPRPPGEAPAFVVVA